MGAPSAKRAGFQFVRAVSEASSAIFASVCIKHKLGLRAYAFGIVAPLATEVTALEENRCPYAGAVNKG